MPMPLGLGPVSAWVCLPSGDTYHLAIPIRRRKTCERKKSSTPQRLYPASNSASSSHRLTEEAGQIGADQIASLRFDDPQTEGWMNSTINILNQAFGQPNREMRYNLSEPQNRSSVSPSCGLRPTVPLRDCCNPGSHPRHRKNRGDGGQ